MQGVRRFGGLMFFLAIALSNAAEDEQVRKSAALLKQMEQVAKSMNFHESVEGQLTEIQLVEKPVLRFSDTPRADIDGTVWAVGTKGRPHAMMKVYTKKTFSPGYWIQAVTSLNATNTVSGRNNVGQPWTPSGPGLVMMSFPDAPPPAKSSAERLRQMKELARLFTGHEYWPADNRHELRLLIQPLHHYEDATAGISDGAVFALAHDTNPEVFILIESYKDSTWRYGLARFGFAEVHVSLRDKEIWTRPMISDTASIEPYWLFHLTLGN